MGVSLLYNTLLNRYNGIYLHEASNVQYLDSVQATF